MSQQLFDLLSQELGVTALESDMAEIERLVNKEQRDKIRMLQAQIDKIFERAKKAEDELAEIKSHKTSRCLCCGTVFIDDPEGSLIRAHIETCDKHPTSILKERLRWRPMEELDRGQMQFVLVHNDGSIRLQLWNPKGFWENPSPIGNTDVVISDPDLWLPLPVPSDERPDMFPK